MKNLNNFLIDKSIKLCIVPKDFWSSQDKTMTWQLVIRNENKNIKMIEKPFKETLINKHMI